MQLLPYLCLSIILINQTSADEIVPRVYGGIDLRVDMHKYLVKLLKYYDTMSISMCSGSIINQQWIISSAHCFPHNVTFVEVRKPGSAPLSTIATLKKSQIVIYPGYIQGDKTLSNYEKDLALLKTTKRIKFNNFVQPMRLASAPIEIGREAIIAGYGKAEAGLPTPREGIAFITKCRFDNTNLICTYGTVKAGSGDSGGSLIIDDELVGVTSCSCKNEEVKDCVTVYVDVFLNLEWIERVMSTFQLF